MHRVLRLGFMLLARVCSIGADGVENDDYYSTVCRVEMFVKKPRPRPGRALVRAFYLYPAPCSASI